MNFNGINSDEFKIKNPKKAVKWFTIVIGAIIAIMVLGYAASLFVEYVQIKEVGEQFTSNFWVNFNVKIATQVISFVIIFVLFFITNLFLKRAILRANSTWTFLKKQWIWVLLSFAIAVFGSSMIREGVFSKFLLFANSTQFSLNDPLFAKDIGYYMFSRPFMLALISSLQGIIGFMTVYTAGLYFLFVAHMKTNEIKFVLQENKSILWHNIINIALWTGLGAFAYKFKLEGLLFNNFGGDLAGAGYTDVKVWATYYKVMPYIFIAVIAAIVFFVLKNKYKAAIISFAVIPLMFGIAVGAEALLSAVVVAPNELAAQSEYMKYNIDMTRKAYEIDNIQEADFSLANTLTLEDLEKNKETVGNIRITDFEATKTALNKLQTIKQYYSFNDTDMVPYIIDGKNTILSVGAREMDKEKLVQITDSYANIVYKYTHGYGAVANPVNTVTTEGQPEFTIRDIPVVTEDGMPIITRPEIYYGELTNDYVIVNSNTQELSYSEGENYKYDGEGGIELNTFNKALFSILYGDYKLFISSQITEDSRIMPNRNIIKRAQMVAPFLTYDEDPYLIIDESGRLKWVLDAYTTSSSFPYAQKIANSNINYVRNSIKVIIDAYDGTPKFYITDETDPIAQVFKKMYPKMFETTPMPTDVAAHLRYPESLFKIQSEFYKKYHITDVNTFYSQQDLWDFARERYNQETTKAIEPYYNMMKIDALADDAEQMILTMPYTLKNRDYITSWLAVGSDVNNYGKMVSYKFQFNDEDKAYGTLQIENRIDNDPQISSEMTLWGQGGSSVIRGNMMVVPIKDSLLYVEPVYITTANEASFPELKRIIVAYGNHIAMEKTLDEALAVVFGAATPSTPETIPTPPPDTSTNPGTPTVGTGDENLNQLMTLYKEYKDCNSRNDFEGAGRAMQKIDELIATINSSR